MLPEFSPPAFPQQFTHLLLLHVFIGFIKVLFGNTLLEQQRSDPSALARVGGSLSALPTSCSLLKGEKLTRRVKSKSLALTVAP